MPNYYHDVIKANRSLQIGLGAEIIEIYYNILHILCPTLVNISSIGSWHIGSMLDCGTGDPSSSTSYAKKLQIFFYISKED